MDSKMNKTKELIIAGHSLAKELHCAESAALVRELAEHLDCALAATRTACAQRDALAAENAGLKSKGREVLKEAAYVYSHYNRMVDHLDGESIDGQTLHEFQAVIEDETPSTDAFLAEVRAQGVDVAIEHLINKFEGAGRIGVPVMALEWLATKLRQGAAL